MQHTDKKIKVLNIAQLVGWIVLAAGLIGVATVLLIGVREVAVLFGPASFIGAALGLIAVIVTRTLKKEHLKQLALIEKYSAEEAEYQAVKEATESFLDSVTYPAGFEEFIKNSESKRFELRGENYLPFEVFKSEEMKEMNMDLIVNTNGYLTQFKDVLLFANDGSGHVYLFLDYGKNQSAPTVNTLDEEADEIRTVCENFEKLLDLAEYEED